MNDPRHHPITMRAPARHEYSNACECGACKAIYLRQVNCQHSFIAMNGAGSMIGAESVCVHCGAAKSHVEAMTPAKPQMPQVVPAGFAPTLRFDSLMYNCISRKPVATTAPVTTDRTAGPHAQWNCPCDDPKCAGKRSYTEWCQRTIAELRAQWVTTGPPQSWI
jgi:hypothetical protein